MILNILMLRMIALLNVELLDVNKLIRLLNWHDFLNLLFKLMITLLMLNLLMIHLILLLLLISCFCQPNLAYITDELELYINLFIIFFIFVIDILIIIGPGRLRSINNGTRSCHNFDLLYFK